MKVKPQQITGSNFILLYAILFLSVNCKQNANESIFQSQTTELDSISAWIGIGRDRSKSITTRKTHLQKAYAYAAAQPSDTTQLKYLSRIQWSFLILSDSTWFRKTNKETNLLARKIGDSTRMAASYWDLGIYQENNNITDSAYYNLLEAKKLYYALDNLSNAGKIEYDIARIQENVKNYTSAEVSVIKAIELLKPLDDSIMLYNCYNLLGIITNNLGDYNNALSNFAIAETYSEKLDTKKESEIILTNNIGNVYEENGDFELAVGSFKKVLFNDSLITKDPELYAMVLNNLARSQSKLKPGDPESERMFLKSLQIRDSLGDKHDLAGGFCDLSKYYIERKDTTKALSNALKAKSYAETSNNNVRLLEALEQLIQIDPKNAVSYSRRHIELNDSLQQEERKIRNKFARIQFETDEVVAQNERLSYQRQLWTGIAGAVFLLAGAIFIIFYQRAKNQKLRFQQKQQSANQEIFNLMLAQSEKLEEGKKLEQKRVSEELHDGVLGRMLGVRMMLLGLNKKNDPEAIAERSKAIATLQNIEGEVRSISHELSHAAYQKIHNFILSIQELIDRTKGATQIQIEFTYTEQYDWDILSGEIKINLYRIIQESIQNAVKHATCSTISVQLTTDASILFVAIEDNGKGFVVKKGRKGIGMRNIASRMEKVNGKWNISSELGKGSKITLSIPLATNHKQNISTILKTEQNLQEI